ncbi:TIGR03118 family protein [Nonomuraea sp. CA-143628]|uniref:TIGR03118 family protein n=1 Tax=Nonomuraea sp. CA-143628 TaxID=3239997 RepID=UPI003D9238E6
MRLRIITLCAGAVVLSTTLTAPAQAATNTKFDVVNLISDIQGKAAVHDPKLVNPWGLAMGKTLWVSDTGTGTATVYSGAGKKEATEVAIPGGAPTGQVFNSGEGFTVKGKPATFIFASPSGAITGWNAEVDPKNAIIAAFTRGADYKGLAMVNTDDGDFLLAADFANGRLAAWNSEFEKINLSRRAFRDPSVPSNYRPYNVTFSGGSVWVAYALRDEQTGKSIAGAGKGFVSRYNVNGRLVGRIARTGLNAPWAVTAAPKQFGAFSGSVLVGNFGDGTIHAYRGNRHLGALRDGNGRTVSLPGLWDLEPGTAATGGENALWFSAGIDKAQHGLVGVLRPAGTGSQVSTPSSSPTPSNQSSHKPTTKSSQSPYGSY